MPVTEEIRTMALERRGVDELQTLATAQGMRTMRDDGVDKVKQGLTTLAEVARVTSAV
jgi:type II secretory ATPase GspE/PulE/Tfp pilus assembly ATPase PilB-like protein